MGFYAPGFTADQVREIPGTRSEQMTLDSRSATVQVHCPWNIRYSVMNSIFLNQVPYPEDGFLLPRDIACVPDRAEYIQDGQQAQAKHDARLTINYATPGDDTPDDPVNLISETIEPTTEFITQDFKKFVWLQNDDQTELRPVKEAEAPGRLLHSLRLVRTLYNRPVLPASILTLPGSCNDAAYTSQILGLTFDAETLLFDVGPLQRSITSEGTEGWTVTIPLNFKPQGWNRTWLADEDRYALMGLVNEATGAITPHKNHPPDDFSDWLF